MEIITGALPSVITKLTDLATGEYNLQKGLKNDIKFLQEELMAMKGALEDISKVPPHQLPNGDDIWATNVRDLSYDIEDKNVGKLIHLSSGGVPEGISNLTSLEVLSVGWICDDTTIIELGHLTELRMLKIILDTDFITEQLDHPMGLKPLEESLVACLHKLKKIRSVDISGMARLSKHTIGRLDAWHALPHLRRIQLSNKFGFYVRPDWMNPSYLPHLTYLCVTVLQLQQEDLDIIGSLPALRDLDLSVHSGLSITIDGSLFPNLVRCKLLNFMPPVVFRQGAMPRLIDLEFTFNVRQTRRVAGSIDNLEFGLENLRVLQNILVRFTGRSDTKKEREEAMDVLRHAVEIHPNRPKLRTEDW
ncbi:hypothetical protein HU200_044090 [Digitaria exilis]|uniref:Disease resistance R13L4/SHOC-2-like LRR domain-containing protein n=1 Tax=Digitaria exilis TaxID=1010633 RepID=A0A835EEH7_9POAL|nr:hypothetical protein HU200_044090 [Digitaria exilis]